jgi:hypothetical protein
MRKSESEVLYPIYQHNIGRTRRPERYAELPVLLLSRKCKYRCKLRKVLLGEYHTMTRIAYKRSDLQIERLILFQGPHRSHKSPTNTDPTQNSTLDHQKSMLNLKAPHRPPTTPGTMSHTPTQVPYFYFLICALYPFLSAQ